MFPVFLRRKRTPALFYGERKSSAFLFFHEAGRDLAPAFAVFQDLGGVGGTAHDISPYMRNANSGSQEKMEEMVMKGTPMLDLPEMIGSAMLSPYESIERDTWGIGYTPYYYCERMVGDLRRVKVLAVDGVYPNAGTILNGAAGRRNDAYPYVSNIYAAIRKDEPADSYARQIYDWLSTPRAKDIVDESGYISMRSHKIQN